MKNTMFKIAGVKNDKEFYDKYPTEDAFMAQHGAAFEKAWKGMSMLKAQGGGSFGNAMEKMGGAEGVASIAGDIAGGIQQIGAQNRALEDATQMAGVTTIQADAAESVDVDANRMRSDIIQDKYNNEMRPINGEELFPIDGVGTNVLAKYGRRMRKGKQPAEKKSPKLYKSKAAFNKAQKAQNGLITKQDRQSIKQDTGIDFTEEGANSLFKRQNKKGFEEYSPIDYNLGKFKDVGYYDVQSNGGRPRIRPTAKNFKNAQGYKQDFRYIQGLNPDVDFNQAQSLNDYIPNSQRRPENYKNGGYSKATSGFSTYMASDKGKDLETGFANVAGNIMNNDAGSQIGGGIGKGLTTLTGIPGLETLGKIGGGLIDRTAEKIDTQQDITDANTNRAAFASGLRNMRTNNPSFQNGGEIQSNGDVETLWGGDLQPVSHNPYTDGEQTMMFDGDTHKEGGIGVNYGGNKIEAEHGEPAMKMQHGGGEEGLVIFGDLPITKETADMIGDPEAKGKKFKKYVEKIAEKENKANAKSNKAQQIASELTPINKFDRLKLGTQEIIQKGSDEKLKQYAALKENAAGVQNAINQTAEELGADPVLLARGGDKFGKWLQRKMNKSNKFVGGHPKSAYAQYGKTVNAQVGGNFISPIEPEQEPYQFGGNEDQSGLGPVRIGQETVRPTYKINNTKYASKQAFLDKFQNMSDINTAKVDITGDDTFNNQVQQEIKNTAVLTPIDKKATTQKVTSKGKGRRRGGAGKGTGDIQGSLKAGYGPQKRNADGSYGGADIEAFKARTPWFDFTDFDPNKKDYTNPDGSKGSSDVVRLQKAMKARSSGNAPDIDGKFGDQTFSYTEGIKGKTAGMDSNFDLATVDPNIRSTVTETETEPEKKDGFDPMSYLNAISPLINKGSDAERLQGNQLLGEMFALSNNQEEPVQATSYKPELDVPYDISLQDQLNRNTSGMRAASRMGQGNPAAQAMLQAQGYAQDQPILAEQFRANQAKKDQVYSANRAALNDAKLKNIDIYDRQYTRQSQAKSNTKEATQLALNSISDKYQKNKLEQRTLKTYENMYNYRFGDNYQARNVNDPTDFKAMWQASQMGNTGGAGATGGMVPVYNNKGTKITGYKVIDKSKQQPVQPTQSTPGINPDAQYNKYGGSITKSLKKF